MTFLKDLITFFKEAYNELKHVTWLTKKEMVASTSVVVMVVCIMTIFVFIIDVILAQVVTRLIKP